MTHNHRLGVLSLAFLFALSLGVGSVRAAGDPEPSPPRSDVKSGGKKKNNDKKQDDKKQGNGDQKKSEQEFRHRYRAAYVTIYDRNDYADAIEQLKALGHDDRAEVANLLGYSYRKLGNYQLAQVWYERALKANPAHVKTWQYYGLWQIEQGNREQAQYHLSRIAALAGTNSEEYRSLAAALEKAPGTSLVY
jgi:tetratricopeptide (TPR) repeat protein